ncbi:hypothetical protein GGR56DRAFT_359885 [Xylariaceae sp. FL0804]|nr:hypothetical protein GGR56DRAFT_359885 [Xylariaceae sp. FL0804]
MASPASPGVLPQVLQQQQQQQQQQQRLCFQIRLETQSEGFQVHLLSQMPRLHGPRNLEPGRAPCPAMPMNQERPKNVGVRESCGPRLPRVTATTSSSSSETGDWTTGVVTGGTLSLHSSREPALGSALGKSSRCAISRLPVSLPVAGKNDGHTHSHTRTHAHLYTLTYTPSLPCPHTNLDSHKIPVSEDHPTDPIGRGIGPPSSTSCYLQVLHAPASLSTGLALVSPLAPPPHPERVGIYSPSLEVAS